MAAVSEPGGRAAVARRLAPPVIAAIAIAIAAWPQTTMRPAPGLDSSWIIGLNLIFHAGYNFGSDVIFTFGPLGFLHYLYAVYPWPLRLSFGWLTVMQVALAATLLWSLRRGFRSWWLAVPLALGLTAILTYEATLVVGFTAAVALIAGLPRTPRETTLVAAALGVLAGMEALSKLNVGVALLLLSAIAAIAAANERRRVAITLAVAIAGTASAGWLLTGQSVIAIPGYIAGALAITSGYSSGMQLEAPGAQWQFWAAATIGVLGAVVAFHAGAGAGLDRRSRAGLVVAWAALWFVAFKIGFVRHDPGHPPLFAADTLGALTAFAWAVRRRDVALLVGLVPLTLYFALTAVNPASLFQPETRARAFVSQARILADGSRTNEEIAASRAGIVAAMPVDQATLDALRGKRIAVEPWEISVPFAYRLPWKPLPVIQSYAAYTGPLDDRNAERLASPEAPEAILRHTAVPLDGRNFVWTSPAAMRELLCRYRQAGVPAGAWQALVRGPSRCGAPREYGRVQARFGEPVPVPPAPGADQLVYVDVDGFGLGPAERLRTALFRAHPRSIVLDGDRPFRIPAENAGGGLLLRVPASADYRPAAFALDLNPSTITFLRGSGEQPGGTLTLRFVAVPIER